MKQRRFTDSYREFEQNLMTIMLMPTILSRKPSAARDRVGKAFEHYYNNGYHEKASLVTRNRYHAMSSNGIPLHDLSKFEVGGSLAFLVNTIPTTFWFLFYIHSVPDLLSEVRREVDANIRIKEDINGVKVHSMDVTSLKASCPVLLSSYQETLRHHAMSNAVREVTKDTILANKYLLKKGAMIQMPTRVIHRDPAVWGEDVDNFRPRRFIKGEKHSTFDGKAPGDIVFRSFGGGKTLCPGRHFATNEIIATVAAFIARFDMTPSSGEWVLPTAWNTSMASAVMTPDKDIKVEISRRKGFEEGIWQISLTDSDMVYKIVAEDAE